MKHYLYFILIIFLSINLYAGKIITSAADPWPPYINPDNLQGGLSLEIVAAAFATQGYEVKHSYIPWAIAENRVKEVLYDILPDAWMTESRKEYMLYSDPYASHKMKFIIRSNDNFEYNGFESLKGKKIGIVKGYGYGDKFMNAKIFKKEDVPEFILNINKLIAGRIDLTLEDEIVATALINQKDPNLLKKNYTYLSAKKTQEQKNILRLLTKVSQK